MWMATACEQWQRRSVIKKVRCRGPAAHRRFGRDTRLLYKYPAALVLDQELSKIAVRLFGKTARDKRRVAAANRAVMKRSALREDDEVRFSNLNTMAARAFARTAIFSELHIRSSGAPAFLVVVP